jgi:hypothetical protein
VSAYHQGYYYPWLCRCLYVVADVPAVVAFDVAVFDVVEEEASGVVVVVSDAVGEETFVAAVAASGVVGEETFVVGVVVSDVVEGEKSVVAVIVFDVVVEDAFVVAVVVLDAVEVLSSGKAVPVSGFGSETDCCCFYCL